MRGFLFRYLFLPLRDRLKREQVARDLRFLRAYETWPEERRKAFVARKLHDLLAFASQRVPFYREYFGGRVVTDLKAFPVLTKEEIRRQPEKFLAEGWQRRPHEINASSGTTGTPFRFYVDRRSISLGLAAQYRFLEKIGHRWGRPILSLWGNPSSYAKEKQPIKRLGSWLRNERVFPSFTLKDPRAFEDLVRLYLQVRPWLLYGYSKALYAFALYLRDRGLEVPPPRAVVATSETLFPSERRVVAEVFRAPVHGQYGFGEILSVAYQCARGYYHTVEPHVVVETRERPGLADPKVREFVVTDLDNRVMPFIRYAPGDLLVLGEEPEPCGWPGWTFQEVLGRTTDLIRTPEGGYVTVPSFFGVDTVKDIPDLRKYQVIQKSLTDFEVKLVVGPAFLRNREAYETRLRRLFQEIVGEVTVRFRYVDDIPPEPTGKYLLVKSELKDEGPPSPAGPRQ